MDISQKQGINISITTLFKIAGVLVLFWFFYIIRDIIALLFASMIVAAVIDPLADWCEKRHIPRTISVLSIYGMLSGILIVAVVLLIPPLVAQTGEFVSSLTRLVSKIIDQLAIVKDFGERYGVLDNVERGITALETGFTKTVGNVFATITDALSGFVSVIMFLVISFYLVVEEGALKRMVKIIAPVEYHVFLSNLFIKIQLKVGSWLRGQLILSMIIGLMVYIGLLILGVNYALVLALLAGLLEFIPYIGPILAAIPAILLAFSISPLKAGMVLILYFIIQQVENNVLVPKVMQKAVGLNPVVSVVAILVGARLGGIVGILFAIPTVTAVDVLLSELFPQKYRGMTNLD